MPKLSCEILLGVAKINYCESVVIDRNVDNLTQTATIVMPRNITNKGRKLETLINKEDLVEIKLGYDGINETVFKGYLKAIKTEDYLLKITCEDEMSRLKLVQVADKHYTSVDLKTLVNAYLPASYTKKDISNLQIGQVLIKDEANLVNLLQKLKEFGAKSLFIGDYFYCGYLSTLSINGTKTWLFDINMNVIENKYDTNDNDERKNVVVAKAILKDNKLIKVTVPKEDKTANIYTFYSPNATTETELKAFANEKLKEISNAKKGTLKLFGKPNVQLLDIIKIREKGNIKIAICTANKIEFGQGGFRQNLQLSNSI